MRCCSFSWSLDGRSAKLATKAIHFLLCAEVMVLHKTFSGCKASCWVGVRSAHLGALSGLILRGVGALPGGVLVLGATGDAAVTCPLTLNSVGLLGSLAFDPVVAVERGALTLLETGVLSPMELGGEGGVCALASMQALSIAVVMNAPRRLGAKLRALRLAKRVRLLTLQGKDLGPIDQAVLTPKACKPKENKASSAPRFNGMLKAQGWDWPTELGTLKNFKKPGSV